MISAIIVTSYHPQRIYQGETQPYLNVAITLNSMLYQHPAIQEIILINQAPQYKDWNDNQIEFIKEEFGTRIRIIEISKRFSFNKSWCLNIGIKTAQCPFIFINDIDCIIEPNFCEIISSKLKILNQKRSDFVMYSTCAGRYEDMKINWITFNYPKDFYSIFQKLPIQKDSPTIPGAPGPLIIKKTTLLSINGYDERYSQLGCEDADMLFRLKRKKTQEHFGSFKLIHQPHINVYNHLTRRNKKHEKYLKDRQNERNPKGWGEIDFPRSEA